MWSNGLSDNTSGDAVICPGMTQNLARLLVKLEPVRGARERRYGELVVQVQWVDSARQSRR